MLISVDSGSYFAVPCSGEFDDLLFQEYITVHCDDFIRKQDIPGSASVSLLQYYHWMRTVGVRGICKL